MTDQPRFWLLDYCTEDHKEDFDNSVARGEIIGIVDEEAGGIIAYACGEKNARFLLNTLSTLQSV